MQKRNSFRETKIHKIKFQSASCFCMHISLARIKSKRSLNNTRRYFTEKTLIGNFKNLLSSKRTKRKSTASILPCETNISIFILQVMLGMLEYINSLLFIKILIWPSIIWRIHARKKLVETKLRENIARLIYKTNLSSWAWKTGSERVKMITFNIMRTNTE